MKEVMITTTDNPFNPFTQSEEWGAFDLSMGYGTMSYLARILITSDDISPADHEAAVETAIDEIMFFDSTGIYKKIYSDVDVSN